MITIYNKYWLCLDFIYMFNRRCNKIMIDSPSIQTYYYTINVP